jgi:hypothetical protein
MSWDTISTSTILFLLVAFLPSLVSLGGRNPVWKFLTFLFCLFSLVGVFAFVVPGVLCWIVAWIFAGVSYATKERPKERGPRDWLPGLSHRRDTESLPSRKCPFCAEMIKRDAIVCKHCGRDLQPLPVLPEGYDGELNGIAYKRMSHGLIEAHTHKGKPVVFRSWNEFKEWVER